MKIEKNENVLFVSKRKRFATQAKLTTFSVSCHSSNKRVCPFFLRLCPRNHHVDQPGLGCMICPSQSLRQLLLLELLILYLLLSPIT